MKRLSDSLYSAIYPSLPVYAQNWACTVGGWARFRRRFNRHIRETLGAIGNVFTGAATALPELRQMMECWNKNDTRGAIEHGLRGGAGALTLLSPVLEKAGMSSKMLGQAGGLLSDARRRIDVDQVRRRLGEAGEGSETAAALKAQLDSAARLDATIADTRDRLRLTTARLDEAVVRAAEVAARAGDPTGLDQLGTDVELLVDDIEALRRGLDEVDRPSTGTA